MFRPVFFLACGGGQVEAVRFLLDLKVETTVVAANKLDAFFMACYKGQTAVVRLFHEEYGVDIKTLRGYRKSTPLHWAAFGARVDLAMYLLDKGAPLDSEDNDDATPLVIARKTQNPIMIALLENYKQPK